MILQLKRYAVELSVLIVGLGLRLLLFRPSYVPMQEDELGYAADGLLLLEGVTPGFKFAPGAFTAWWGFAYGFANWIINSLRSLEWTMDAPALVRPLVALDRTLFDIYADMSGLHAVIAGAVLIVSLLGIYSASRIGRHFAGWPGALLAGGLTAMTPLLCWVGVQSRPYSPAWSLTIVSASVLLTCQGSRRWLWAGMIFGLAVASRIEMLLTIPLLLWLVWIVPGDLGLIRAGTRMGASAILTFLVSAPWFATHLVGNVRKMITVRFLGAGSLDTSPMDSVMINEGLVIVAIVLLVGLFLRCRTDRWKAGIALAYMLLIGLELLTGKTSGGLRHFGHALVMIVVLSGYALAGIQDLSRKRWTIPVSALIAVLALSLPLSRSLFMAREIRSSWVQHDAVGWIESNVPPGSRVFMTRLHARIPLPTEASADLLWGMANRRAAWSEKLRKRLEDVDADLEVLPRGLSMEHMYQEQAGLRRYFILGGGSEGARPRYDLRLVSRDKEAGFQAALEEFRQDGGVFWHAGRSLDKELGPHSQAWLAPDGDGVFLYSRPPGGSRATLN